MAPLHSKVTPFELKYGTATYQNLWLLVNLIQTTRTVNLNKLKHEVGRLILRKNGKITKSSSHYTRLTRFFSDHADDENFFIDVSKILIQLLSKKGGKLLVLDGTKWDKSRLHIHYLMLSIVIRGVSIPIYFVDLEKAGASSQEERIAFLEKALQLLDLEGMTLLGDREFVGTEWFKSLIDKKLGFIIRARKGDYAEAFTASQGKSYDRCWQSCLEKKKTIAKYFELAGVVLKMVFTPNRDPKAEDPVVVLVSTWSNKKQIAETYLQRWKIERMFRHLKTDGFDLEKNNLGFTDRKSLLTLLVCIAFAIPIRKVNDDKAKSRCVKRNDGTVHARESVFQMGLDLISHHRRTMEDFIKLVTGMINAKNNPILSNV